MDHYIFKKSDNHRLKGGVNRRSVERSEIHSAYGDTKKRRSEKNATHSAYGDAKRRWARKKRHPSTLWRHQKALNQKNASSIGIMETPKGAGREESVIQRAYGDTKRRRTEKKRYPSSHQRTSKSQICIICLLLVVKKDCQSAASAL